MAKRAFVAQPRCIYTGERLDPSSDTLKPSHEHIIPLALGGSNGFTTDDVSAEANSKAAKEIDDAVASLLPILMLRHKYRLVGHRKVIPNVKFKGVFEDINAPARLDITADGTLMFEFENEQKTHGHVIMLASTEERVRFLLKGRLEQAKQRRLNLLTPFGAITDEEDIEIALMLADQKAPQEFKARVTINLNEYHFAIARLMIKIALGAGHRVLGPEWTFGPGGHALRQVLFLHPGDTPRADVAGTIQAELDENFLRIVRVRPDTHVIAVLPARKKTVAIIALFGGDMGVAVINLGSDQRKFFNKALRSPNPVPCVFEIPIVPEVGKRRVHIRDIQSIANESDALGLLLDQRPPKHRD